MRVLNAKCLVLLLGIALLTLGTQTMSYGGVCQAGDVLAPGESCTYPGTGDTFSVLNNGSGQFLFLTAGTELNINNTTINGKPYTFVANKRNDGSWEIEKVGSSVAPPPDPPQQSDELDILMGHTETVYSLAFVDNTTLISGSTDKTVRAWDIATGTQKWSQDVDIGIFAVAVPSHGRSFVAYNGLGSIEMRYTDDNTLRGKIESWGLVLSLAFKPGTYLLASGHFDGTIRIWDTEDVNNLRLVRTLGVHTESVNSVAWSPDGSILASGDADFSVRLWDPNDSTPFATLRGHTDKVRAVAWSPDGALLASGSLDDTIRLWDPNTHQTVHEFTGGIGDGWSVAFSPDGGTLASGSVLDTIHLWNPNTGTQTDTLTGHTGGVLSVAFSPDGSMLASGSFDGTIRLWELPTMDGTGDDTDDTLVAEDVNGDGIVNIQDVVLVASQFGTAAADSTADVNGDGTIDIRDLVLVAGALGAGAAAPSQLTQSLEMLTAADIRYWLSQGYQVDTLDARYLRGVQMLEQLLAILTPKETALLANYPNPFNPETWIPYQLAKAAPVTLRIYSANGTLIRTLAPGHQPAGSYQTRSRAAYWDGKNELGEPVASGIYFYSLSAGEFTATRKMLIRK